jgi:predicted RNA-binding Zn-ribbon protein involved in translation (DUF1610 family)
MTTRTREENEMASIEKTNDVCVSCGIALYEDEYYNCDNCHAETLSRLLVSPRWIKARPHMADELLSEWQETHDRICARMRAIVAA